MKFNITANSIKSTASNNDVCTQGEKLYANGKVKNLVSVTQKNFTIIKYIVSDEDKDYYSYLIFDNYSELSDYRCNCSGSRIWKGACKHVVAGLFVLINQDKIKTEAIRDYKAAEELLNTLESENVKINTLQNVTETYDNRLVNIVPTLIVDYNNVYLKFQLGYKRLYTLKDLHTFFQCFKDKKVFSYGKELVFLHILENLNDLSQELFKLMQNEDEKFYQAVQILKGKYYYTATKDSNSYSNLLIFPQGLDDFFELFKGKEIPCSIRNYSNDSIKLNGEHPDFKFKVIVENDSVSLKCEIDEFEFIDGYQYVYIAFRDNLYRVEKEYSKTVIPILKSLEKSSNRTVTFTKNNSESATESLSPLSRFLSGVLPKLKDFGLVDYEEIYEKFNIMNLTAKFYLDLDGYTVNCKIIFNYGDFQLNPLSKAQIPVMRNSVEEREITNFFAAYCFNCDYKNEVYTLKDDNLVYHFYKEGVERLNNLGEVFATDEFTNKSPKIYNQNKSLGVRISGNLLAITLDTSEYNFFDLIEAVSSYKLKKNYHRLSDGSFLELTEDTFSQSAEFISSLDLSKKDYNENSILLPAYKALFLEELLEDKKDLEVSRDMDFTALVNDFKNYKDLKIEIPDIFEKSLRDYQKTGFKWLKTLSHYKFGGILADDMGLGKTVQIIALLYSEKDNKMPSIVVAPTSLIYNWENEILKFAPDLKLVVLAGTAAKRKEIFEENQDTNVFITTYDMLKRDIQNYKGVKFRYVVADEAQNIKNPATYNAKALKTLDSEIRFALTGTPIENNLLELWSLFDFILPGYLHNSKKFSNLYESPIVKEEDHETRGKLRKQIAPFILRRLKKDVIKELPEKVETTIYAEMEQEQKKIYTAHFLKARGDLDAFTGDAFNKSRIEILSLLTRLRQICCHPKLFIENYNGGSGKLTETIELIKNSIMSGHRILVFSQFTQMLSLVEKELIREKIEYFYLDGSTPSKDRMTMSERFNNGEKELFLISLKAGGTGLNLIGADIVIHFDPWWNPSVMAQASDRAHRIGQENVVQVFNIVAKDSIEEKIVKLQEKKKDLVESVIKEGEQFISKMNENDIKELFL